MTDRSIFLGTKVARRILLLFVVSALVPITVLAGIAWIHVSRQLQRQSEERLVQASKAVGMSVLQRIQFADGELGAVAFALRGSGEGGAGGSPERDVAGRFPGLRNRFHGISLHRRPPASPDAARGAGDGVTLSGHAVPAMELSSDELEHLSGGSSVLRTTPLHEGGPQVVLVRPVPAAGGGERSLDATIAAELRPEYLWGFEELAGGLPPATDFCIFREDDTLLACTTPESARLATAIAEATGEGRGTLEWEGGDGTNLAGYWSLFLGGNYRAPSWTIVLSEPKASVLAPMDDFRSTFPLVVLGAILLVLLLSNVQIRRSLVPLEKLKAATRRVARRDFRTPVEVESGDEFEELASAFNAMSVRLERQFRALTTMDEIDRAVLSSLDRESIVRTVLDRIAEVLPCRAAAVTLLEDGGSSRASRTFSRRYGGRRASGWATDVREVRPSAGELELLAGEERVDAGEDGDAALPSFVPARPEGEETGTVDVFPVLVGGRSGGAVSVEYPPAGSPSPDDRLQARQLADQVAVALSNAELLRELDELSWGALTALGRAIDVKSRWTSGHSERVAHLALSIGRELGLELDELETLQRGALLHDIGKIGIPAAVLDKPGALDDAEAELMRNHVEVGEEILAPIPQYADILPIIRHHHERYDGGGYPDGLEGEEIDLFARIIAVADSFDALTSDRPYRLALDREDVLAVIRQNAGSWFDPDVVAAFLRVMAWDEEEREEKGATVVHWPDLAPRAAGRPERRRSAPAARDRGEEAL